MCEPAKVSEPVDLSIYLVEALREDVASLEAELDVLRGSLRYRVGDLVLQMAVSPMRSGLRPLHRLVRLLLGARRRAAGSSIVAAVRDLPDVVSSAPVIVLGRAPPEHHSLGPDLWITDDVEAVCRRIDSGVVGDRLVIRRAEPAFLRRLERARLAGWRVTWWPEPGPGDAPSLALYARAHADECREDAS